MGPQCLELPIARTDFDSPLEFEPVKFYCTYFTPKMLKIAVILKELFTQEKIAVILTDLFTQETVRNTSENNIPIFHRSC